MHGHRSVLSSPGVTAEASSLPREHQHLSRPTNLGAEGNGPQNAYVLADPDGSFVDQVYYPGSESLIGKSVLGPVVSKHGSASEAILHQRMRILKRSRQPAPGIQSPMQLVDANVFLRQQEISKRSALMYQSAHIAAASKALAEKAAQRSEEMRRNLLPLESNLDSSDGQILLEVTEDVNTVRPGINAFSCPGLCSTKP
eukprot:TRINITY_DN78140_c0_g1_i1.p1 TRINITY_DN78140_c0_g1~~TRINITY_DN78140_c0_g1_i1.p1  ORF type:complete len:211 (+),score=16.49 TRINITY_DN78140_c0_g1_i1:39-635(+)